MRGSSPDGSKSPWGPLEAWIRDLVQWSVLVRVGSDILQAAFRTLPSGLAGGLWLGFIAATGGLIILWVASLNRTLSQGVPLMKRLSVVLSLVVVALLAFPSAALAAGWDDGKIVVGGDYILKSGEVLDGDLIVIGGTATLEAGSEVTGTVGLIGSQIDVSGVIDGDLSSIGGRISLGPAAVVHGDLVTLGSTVARDPGAVVEGQVTSGAVEGPFDLTVPGVVIPRLPRPFIDLSPLSWTLNFGWYFMRAFLLAALAVLVVMFWPLRAGRVAQTAVAQPLAAGGLGLLSFLVALPVIAILLLTICLSPLAVLGGLLLVVAYTFGWIAIGLEVGQRLAAAFRQDWTLAVSAGVGTLVLTLVVYGINFIPCIGVVAPAVTYCLAPGGRRADALRRAGVPRGDARRLTSPNRSGTGPRPHPLPPLRQVVGFDRAGRGGEGLRISRRRGA